MIECCVPGCKRKPVKNNQICQTCISLLSRYGISSYDRDKLLKDNNNSCKICDRQIQPSQSKGTNNNCAVVDHIHGTKIVRGIICGACNSLLGHGKDNPTILRRAADYLEASEEFIDYDKKTTDYITKTGVCPHCGFEGQLKSMHRWHFDNCIGERKRGKNNRW